MAGAEDRENTNEIMQFVLTGKQKIYISFSGALSSSTRPSSCCAFRINLLMDVTLQPLPKVVVLLFFFFFFFFKIYIIIHIFFSSFLSLEELFPNRSGRRRIPHQAQEGRKRR